MKFEIHGRWKKGYAFDLHTVASTYLGPDEFGHDRFENARSEMGDLVYRLKYQKDQSVVPRIIRLLDGIKGIEEFGAIIPVPSSNRARPYQPVDEIARALGESRNVPVLAGFLAKTAGAQLKNVGDPEERRLLLEGAITIAGEETIVGRHVLLVDDLYRSGATLDACCSVLLEHARVASVCVLTMTRTRSKR
jgi:competence protein ComFC